MDFFRQQDQARRYTLVLVSYFVIALILIMMAVNVIFYVFFAFVDLYPYTPESWFSSGPVYYISIATLALVLGGSLYRWFQLKSGGHAVAAMMGGQRINLSTDDAKQQQLINVVEEMSIASGVTLPTIYIMEEAGINAFVAGYLPTEAVMVITSGALEQLTREELQGVVAHEFSHILNGDMQINVKLMAVLGGILLISGIGRLLLSGHYGSSSRSYGRSTSGGKSSGAIIVLGLMLLVVGYIGVLAGRMIKAAVSRQREYLADAAAVQFTRNPTGIASALYKISQAKSSSLLRHPHAEDLSHMCFSYAVKSSFSGWFATHPPLTDRIFRVDSRFLSLQKAKKLAKKINENTKAHDKQAEAKQSNTPLTPDKLAAFAAAVTAAKLSGAVGQLDQPHMDYASKAHDSFSQPILDALHEKAGAKLLVLSLILSRMKIQDGLGYLKGKINSEDEQALVELNAEVVKVDKQLRLSLFDLSVPSLKTMAVSESQIFIDLCEGLAQCDKVYTLHEFVLLSLINQHLAPDAAASKKIKYHSFKVLRQEMRLLLSLMLYCSGAKESEYQVLFDKLAPGFMLNEMSVMSLKDITSNRLKLVMSKLARLSPMLKKNIIEACADIALHNGLLGVTESELLRAVSGLLNCPLPPIINQLQSAQANGA